jgi:KUP system potassium uptake protein
MGLLGAALICGNGVITPAISVLSALEGDNVVTSSLKAFVMPAAVTMLLALLAVQRPGTAKIGRAFGPIMLLWFIVNSESPASAARRRFCWQSIRAML